ncbi:DUF3040 domain-containing protein [Kitasatospora sp. A2-31]|uniref:DUF3040 domain-containing protein n=1 Tax=Kitasatospora sp. A2-31 TaxID=2916414 RepID=UPI001EEBCAA4|nr:DUF3040 domain-containing protein [Kitasatospora sp. A2-31]MCG6498405.1 DUF3040 domain-containing protein [Kitasatospora sp. A2-31]
MAVHLSTGELRALAALEVSLRTTDPALDRLLRRRRSLLNRLSCQPLALVVWVAAAAALTACSLICAAAFTAAACAPALLGAAATALGFLRLHRLARR